MIFSKVASTNRHQLSLLQASQLDRRVTFDDKMALILLKPLRHNNVRVVGSDCDTVCTVVSRDNGNDSKIRRRRRRVTLPLRSRTAPRSRLCLLTLGLSLVTVLYVSIHSFVHSIIDCKPLEQWQMLFTFNGMIRLLVPRIAAAPWTAPASFGPRTTPHSLWRQRTQPRDRCFPHIRGTEVRELTNGTGFYCTTETSAWRFFLCEYQLPKINSEVDIA